MESLPPDQRAVLDLVLRRGRSYDDIAKLLSIDRAAVRDRALAALDALGPSTRVPAPRRALITDYLLGQLPVRVRQQVRESLASSASERAWARVLAGELAPIADKPLPEIPASDAAPAAEPAPAPAADPVAPAAAPGPPPPATPAPVTAATPPGSSGGLGVPPPVTPGRRSSRRGGAILLVLAGLVVVVVVVVVIATSGGSNNKKPASTKSVPSTTTTTTGTTTTAKVTPHIVAQVTLTPPSGSSKAAGVADVVTEGKVTALIVAAKNMTPNTSHNAYAVWLYSPGGASKLLGYVSPGVGKNGELKTTGELPSNVASYKDLLITLETTTDNKTPGPTVLQGVLGLS